MTRPSHNDGSIYVRTLGRAVNRSFVQLWVVLVENHGLYHPKGMQLIWGFCQEKIKL
jgi:hypothetical protein